MIEFDEILVAQASFTARVVWWAFKPTNDDLTGLEVEVQRSYSQTDSFARVAVVRYPITYYVDTEVNLRDFWRDAYYKLAATFQGRTVVTEPRGLASIVSVPAREMIRLHNLDLRFSGMPVLVYLVRKGDRCPDCWDPVLKKVTRSSCTTCYATGFKGGYYSPVLTLANIVPEEKTNQPDVTMRESTRTMLKMSNFPALRPRDVIREVNSGILWRVEKVSSSELERVVIIQECNLIKLETSEVEHKLPIPDGLDFLIKPHWAKIIRNQQEFITRNREQNPVEKLNIWRG